MANNKVDRQNKMVRDLVYYFTHNKNLTRQQQARRDSLFARDCIAVPVEDEKPIVGVTENRTTSKEIIRFTSPKYLHDFLFAYNQNEVLKYTCHEIDTQETVGYICEKCGTKTYSLRKHAKLISDSFDVLMDDFERRKVWINHSFYSMLKAYISGNANWKRHASLTPEGKATMPP